MKVKKHTDVVFLFIWSINILVTNTIEYYVYTKRI